MHMSSVESKSAMPSRPASSVVAADDGPDG
jgi:hypothetical protein